MIVVDVNIIAYLLIEGEKTQLARQLYQFNSSWHAPSLWSHEFLNVLASNVKFGGITLSQANEAWENGRILLSKRTKPIDPQQALALAVKQQISAYDAQYIVLAHALNCPLLTEDAKLCNKLPDTAVRMADFLAV